MRMAIGSGLPGGTRSFIDRGIKDLEVATAFLTYRVRDQGRIPGMGPGVDRDPVFGDLCGTALPGCG